MRSMDQIKRNVYAACACDLGIVLCRIMMINLCGRWELPSFHAFCDLADMLQQ